MSDNSDKFGQSRSHMRHNFNFRRAKIRATSADLLLYASPGNFVMSTPEKKKQEDCIQNARGSRRYLDGNHCFSHPVLAVVARGSEGAALSSPTVFCGEKRIRCSRFLLLIPRCCFARVGESSEQGWLCALKMNQKHCTMNGALLSRMSV